MRSENRELHSFAALRRGRNQRLATKRASTSPSNGAARRCPPVSGNPLPAKSLRTGRQQRPACGRLHRPGPVRPPQHQTSCPAPQLTHRHPRHFPRISPTIISRDRQWEPLESPRFIDPEHPLVAPAGRAKRQLKRRCKWGAALKSGGSAQNESKFSVISSRRQPSGRRDGFRLTPLRMCSCGRGLARACLLVLPWSVCLGRPAESRARPGRAHSAAETAIPVALVVDFRALQVASNDLGAPARS